jgi:hypothetical protein
MTKRFLRYSGLGLAVLTVGAIAACGSDSPSNPGGSAGSTPTAGAPSGGGATAGAGAPSLGGGTSQAGASTAGGTSTAGAAGTGTGGAGAGFACVGTKPASALITSFADLVPTTDPATAGNYTFLMGIPGGTFSYQPKALTLSSTGMALNVKGNIHDYDGFGIYLTSCTDASAYTGISFTIKGNVGTTGMLNFRVQTNSNTVVDTKNMKGACVPASTADTYPSCHHSGFDIPVTAGGATVMVNFSQLGEPAGVPVAAVTGKDIVGLEWAFTWTPPAAMDVTGGGAGGTGGASAGAGGSTNPGAGAGGASAGAGGAVAGGYDADVTIDDIMFIGGTPGGAGGAGGGASAGAAGASAGAGGSAGAAAGAGGSGGAH